jgi:anti-sigma-K factor RskA
MSIDIHALSGAYAVDALDGAERTEFERHLSECPSCQHEVDSLREAAATLSGAVETAPPERLRASVLQGISEVRPLPPVVRPQSVGRVRRWWAAGSFVLAASLASAVVISHPWSSTHAPANDASRVMTAADVQVIHSAVNGGGSLTWYRSNSIDKAVVTSHDLTALPDSQVYELWLERPNGTMVAAGFLDGSGSTVVLNGEARTAIGAGVTVEPAGGSAKPTLPPVSLAAFGKV